MTLPEIWSVGCQKSEGRLRSESCHKRALARSAEWTESLPRGARIAEVARVAERCKMSVYVVRVAGKTTQEGMCCRASTEGCVSPGTRNTAEKQRACVAVYVMCRLAPEDRREAEGVCRRVPCWIRKRACVAVCVHNWRLLYRKLGRSSRLQEG